MPRNKSASNIIIAGQPFPIDWPTFNFKEDAEPGYDAHHPGCTRHARGKCKPDGLPYQPATGLGDKLARVRPRRMKEQSVAAARGVIKHMVVHLDGCADAEMCFNVLHNERGLSCHFILDNDGTIYQTVDLLWCAYHAAGLNETSIGIELCNRGDAKKDRGYYDDGRKGPKRDVVTCEVNGHKYIAYDFTREQYAAMEALGKALARHLPGLKLEYPQASPGAPLWGTLEPAKLRDSAGYIGHYHITPQKWDPGPFDFKRFIGKLAGRRSFPIGLHGREKPEVPEVPREGDRAAREAYEEAFDAYYDNNELQGRGGYFPVGPVDRAQLYHGGVHLRPKPGQPVFAPLPGKVVLARNGPVSDADVGSTSFVLLGHNQKIGDVRLVFWSLYMHLAEEKGPEKPRFMKAKSFATDAEPNRVHALDPPEPVQAGDVIGHAGVGPGGEPTLHWEIFTLTSDAVEKLGAGFWTFYSGAGQGRFCTQPEIMKKMDVVKKDGVLTEEELLATYRGDDRLWTRRAVTQHPSEWGNKPAWRTELANAPELKGRPAREKQLEELFERQILPTLWWTDDFADLAGLPADPMVFTYHPVSFLRWFNDLVGTARDTGPRKTTAADYAGPTGTGQLDIDDRDGTSFVSEAELAVDTGPGLTIEDLADGYGD